MSIPLVESVDLDQDNIFGRDNLDNINSSNYSPVNFDESSLSPDEVNKVKSLLCKYADLFNDLPGRTHKIKHKIKTFEGISPIRQSAYRTSPPMKQEIRLMIYWIEKLLKKVTALGYPLLLWSGKRIILLDFA